MGMVSYELLESLTEMLIRTLNPDICWLVDDDTVVILEKKQNLRNFLTRIV